MTRRILSVTAITLGAVLVTAALLAAWLLGTQSGSRLLWSGVSRAVDGLEAEAVEGRFAGSLAIRGLHYETDTMRIAVASLQLTWLPARLLAGDLVIEALQVDEVNYTQLKPGPGPEPEPEPGEAFALPDSISLPVAIEVRELVLRSVDYRSAPDAGPVRLDELALAASFRDSELAIDRLSAHGPLFRIEARATAQTRDNYTASASLDWQATPPDYAPVAGTLSLSGGLDFLSAEQTIDAPYSSFQQIEVRDVLNALTLDALLEFNDTRLEEISATLPVLTLSGTVRAEGAASDLAYRADLDADSAELGALALQASGDFRNRVVTIGRLLLTRAPGTARLELGGRVDLAGATPTFNLQGDWNDLAWPLVGAPRINSGVGKLMIEGSAEDYALTLQSALAVPDRGDGELTLAGHGGSDAFELDDLRLDLLDGYLTGQGGIRWNPDMSGVLTLSGDGLNPAVLAPDFPGDLALELRADGGIVNGAVNAEIESLSLSGSFRERQLDLQAVGRLEGAEIELETLNLRSGGTRINATGSAGERMALQWDIDSPDLGDLLPDAGGSLSGSGVVEGTVAMPAVRGDLRGDAITYADYRLNQLRLELDVDPANGAPSVLELNLDQLLLAGVEISRLDVRGSGTPSAHTLGLQLLSPEGNAQLNLAGNFLDTRWQGELTSGELQFRNLAPWNLEAPQALALSADEQRLAQGCWTSGEASLCLQAKRAEGDLDADLNLNAFGLDYLRPLMGESISLSGTLNARANARRQDGAAPVLGLAVQAEGVELRRGESLERGGELLLSAQPSELQVSHDSAGLLADLSMPFTGGGGIKAKAEVPAGSEPLTQRPLRGELAFALGDLTFLSVLSPEIEAAAGTISSDFRITGTLENPVPEGDLRLAEASVALATPGLSITDISVDMRSSAGAELSFDGQATSGEGTLSLNGSALLDGARSVADIAITGEGFEAVNTRDAQVFLSPDLQVAVRENGVKISGEVAVPRAEITPQNLPESVVSASDDQVIVTSDTENTAMAARREVEANLRVVLGDDVYVDGFGFKGRLGGGLTISQSPGQPTLGNGELNILDGEYRAYGQGLVIDRGRILFAGGPLAQPGIDVRALRRPAEGIVVGVSVQGPLENPDFNVFSEPGMTQSEQLSWLVLGRPLDNASEGESSMIAQAAMALGVRGGNFLADRFGGGLGVDSVGIETGSGEAGAASDVNQAAFVIGKYLSPDLFVSYGIGLFDSVSTVRLEYSLTENWKVSTETSTLSSGGDVTYTIER